MFLSFLGIVIAVGIAAYWLGRERGLADGLSIEMKAAESAREVRLRAEIVRLASENERIARQRANTNSSEILPVGQELSAPTGEDPLDRLHTISELQSRKLATVLLPVINKSTAKLSAGFIELFALTPAETAKLQEAIDQTRLQTEQLMRNNASVSRLADGSVVISIAPSDSGNSLRDELFNAFAKTLGRDRNEAFLALQGDGSNQIGNALAEFGTQQRTLTLSHAPSPDGGGQKTNVRDEQKFSQGGSMNSMNSYQNVAAIPASISWAFPLLPPDF